MADYKVTDTELTSIANAIRTKGGTQAQLEFPTGFVSAVQAIPTGGGSTNILSGGDMPSASIGNNGDVYLRFFDDSEFVALEYLGIESNGGPYIDTGFILTPDTECEVDMQYTSTPNNNSWMFGSYQVNKQTTLGYTQGTIWLQVGGANTGLALDNNRHVYKATHTNFLIDGVVQSGQPNWSNTVQSNVRLFYINDGSPSNNCKLYSCKLWNNDTLVRYFVPAKRVSDGVLGLLDVVNIVFYTNTGSGSFVGGEEESWSISPIIGSFCKVNGVWQSLIGTDINDVNLGGN